MGWSAHEACFVIATSLRSPAARRWPLWGGEWGAIQKRPIRIGRGKRVQLKQAGKCLSCLIKSKARRDRVATCEPSNAQRASEGGWRDSVVSQTQTLDAKPRTPSLPFPTHSQLDACANARNFKRTIDNTLSKLVENLKNSTTNENNLFKILKFSTRFNNLILPCLCYAGIVTSPLTSIRVAILSRMKKHLLTQRVATHLVQRSR